MDKQLLKQLRKMKVKAREITPKEKQKIEEYVDDKKYTLETLELLKIEMQFQKDRKYSIIFPVILSIFATLILEIIKKASEWIQNYMLDELRAEETYNLVKKALEAMDGAVGDVKEQIISGMIQIGFAYVLLFLCLLVLSVIFLLFIWFVLLRLAEGLHEKDKVYQYYYEEYINEKINKLKPKKIVDNNKESSLLTMEDLKVEEDIGLRYYVNVQGKVFEKNYIICLKKGNKEF